MRGDEKEKKTERKNGKKKIKIHCFYENDYYYRRTEEENEKKSTSIFLLSTIIFIFAV